MMSESSPSQPSTPISLSLVDAAQRPADLTESAWQWLQSHRGLDAETDQYLAEIQNLLAGKENLATTQMVEDVQLLMQLNEHSPLKVTFHQKNESDNHFSLKLFYTDQSLSLSSMMPMLENLGFSVIATRPYQLTLSAQHFYIHEFELRYQFEHIIHWREYQIFLEDALQSLWRGWMDNDGMNRLILAVGLDWRQVCMLRSYSKYFVQIKLGFSQRYVESVLLHHPEITRNLSQLFIQRFDPAQQEGAEQREQILVDDINEALELVDNIDEDRILRRYVDLIQGTVRTNFYQTDAQGQFKSYIAYKFLPRTIPDLPKPLPFYEIFVYSPQMEGLHLRSGKIARGGIRCSDRLEDYRSEILALMKAQQVKNSAIVPMGAAGGFIAKNSFEWMSEDQQKQVTLEAYGIFISGLLDITDNLKDNQQVIPPENVVCKDDEDYYLVVSDDRSTKDLADMANAISIARQFWLKDAFASGGSVGYDPKKMGLTAKGVWTAVNQHVRELKLDAQQPLSLIGIGSPSSDLLGNALLSPHIHLVAAFDQSHIFIDPNPDAQTSFAERQRLFNKPQASWADYDAGLISAGGGIFSRHVKTIQTTSEMRLKLQIGALRLTPNELIQYLLKAPVDILWNGGSGTYIKATLEQHADIADKTNDNIRVDGIEVQAKIVAEGGNLGVTQLGRVEYALRGGLSHTDFCDNAAGVDCSDHEVNLKILLQDLIHQGVLESNDRKMILDQSSEEVARSVLLNHKHQIEAIGMVYIDAEKNIDQYRRYIQALVQEGKLERELEYLPSDEEIYARQIAGTGFTRAELAVLLAYEKNNLKEALMASNLPEDEYIQKELLKLFPSSVSEKYTAVLYQHPLKREMISTHIANQLVNFMGITFVYRMKEASAVTVSDIVKAYIVARDVFQLEDFWQLVEAAQSVMTEEQQKELLLSYGQLMRVAIGWLLANKKQNSVMQSVMQYAEDIKTLRKELPLLLVGERLEIWEARFAQYSQLGIDETLATWAASMEGLAPALAILQTADTAQQPILEVAKVFYELGDRLNLYWFSQQIEQLPTENHWQALAKEGYRDELDSQQRRLTAAVLNFQDPALENAADENCQLHIRHWLMRYQSNVHRWRMLTHEFELSPPRDFAMYAVALRELGQLAS